jgi:ribonuclease HI
VQLYTDASSYHATKAGAWAAILVLPTGEHHEAHDRLRGDITSSTSAEARAVANGLHHFIARGLIKNSDHVTVVCDNKAVVTRIGNGKKSKGAEVQEALAAIHRLASGYALKLSGEWVKGHQPAYAEAEDPRVTFNRRCDKLCTTHGKSLNRERCDTSRVARTHEEAA